MSPSTDIRTYVFHEQCNIVSLQPGGLGQPNAPTQTCAQTPKQKAMALPRPPPPVCLPVSALPRQVTAGLADDSLG